MTNKPTNKQTPSIELSDRQRLAAKRIRESGGPAADLADVLIQLDTSDASESDSTPSASSSLAI